MTVAVAMVLVRRNTRVLGLAMCHRTERRRTRSDTAAVAVVAAAAADHNPLARAAADRHHTARMVGEHSDLVVHMAKDRRKYGLFALRDGSVGDCADPGTCSRMAAADAAVKLMSHSLLKRVSDHLGCTPQVVLRLSSPHYWSCDQ